MDFRSLVFYRLVELSLDLKFSLKSKVTSSFPKMGKKVTLTVSELE